MKLLITTKRALLLLAALLALALGTASSAAAAGLTVQNGTIYSNGQPYHAVAVNWFDLFQQHIASGDSSYVSGMQALAAHNIRLVRFAASSLPTDTVPNEVGFQVWQSNPTRWWSAMDDVFREAEQDGVGLIADLDWVPDAFPILAGQQTSQLANPHSRSSTLMAKYIGQFVQRYKSSPALMGYEAGNEFNLYADTGQYPFLSASQVTAILQNTGADIKAYDSSRLIESGDGLDRPSAWHLAHGGTWTTDTAAEWAQMENQFNPFPAFSAHVGSEQDASVLNQLVSLGKSEGKPVIVGELDYANAAQDQAGFQQLFNNVVNSGAPISLLWTYDTLLIPNFPWSATFTNDLAFEMQAVAGQNP